MSFLCCQLRLTDCLNMRIIHGSDCPMVRKGTRLYNSRHQSFCGMAFFFAKFALFPVTIFLRTFAHQITTEAEQLFRNILHHTQQVLRLWRNAKLFAQNYQRNLLKNQNCAILYSQIGKLREILSVKNKIAQKATFCANHFIYSVHDV